MGANAIAATVARQLESLFIADLLNQGLRF
jgi:Rod binding domain-containing protein